ncbi:hypothetical protein [Amycolatopsis viridis]|uniref:Uncharacterized protein n=1 Tax=Amycolatopsis viridis TaxID=185678 RepID=A0ABX0SWY2_9PSEU|nr:hypothetical protein [Amycolatopsis viridis]NIH81468.1 hypothetical protein [Amycolatopsis viridis]
MSYLEISTSVAEIRSLFDRVASTGTDLTNLLTSAASTHSSVVGGDTEMSAFGDDELGERFKPSYRDLEEGAATGSTNLCSVFSPTKAGQFFQAMAELGDELSKLGGGGRAAIDEQMSAELDNVAALGKTYHA